MTEQREIELRMLNLLRDPWMLKQYGHRVKPRFLSPEGQVIFRSLVYAGAVETLDVDTLNAVIRSQYRNHDLKKVFGYTDLMGEIAWDAGNHQLVARLFSEQFDRMALREMINMATEQLDNGMLNIEAIKDVLTDSAQGPLSLEPTDFTTLSELLEARERIPTGIGSLDEEFQGGLGVKELGIVAGPPKRGKSAVMVNMTGAELKAGRPVLYITLADLFLADVMTRVAVWYGGVTEQDIMDWPDLLADIQADMEKRGARLYVADRNHLETTVGEIENVIEQVKTESPELRLVIVDRADTLVSPGKYNEMRHRLKDIYTHLRRIAAATGVAIWADSQADASTFTTKRVGMAKSSEDKVGKTGITDLWLGITRDQEDREVHWVTIDGRRKIKNEFHRFRLNTDFFTLTQEATYSAEDDE